MKRNLLLAIMVFTINAFAQKIPTAIQLLSKNSMKEISKLYHSSNDMMTKYSITSPTQQSVLMSTSEQKLDSSYSASWDPYSKSWGYANAMKIFNYNASGFQTSTLSKKLNNGLWVIDNQTILSYDTNNNLESSSTQYYSAGTWFETARTTNSYDANGQIINTLMLSLDFNTFLLVNKYRVIYTYDANHNQTDILRQEWIADVWVTIYESISTFDTNNNMTSWLYSWWTDGAISGGEKDIATYNANYEITGYISQIWDAPSSTWMNSIQLVNIVLDNTNATIIRNTQESLKYIYSNPIFSNIKYAFSSYKKQKWVNSVWVDDTKYTPELDSNNNLASASIKTWTNGLWKDYINWACSYDANMKLISTTDDTWNVAYWAKRRTNYSYDANMNITSSIGETFQNGNVNDWVISNTTYTTFNASNSVISNSARVYLLDGKMTTNSGDTIYNYYHAAIAGVNGLKMTENDISVYPNPSNGRFKIHSDLKSIQSIEIFDINGRQIFTDTKFNNSDEVDLSSTPKGIYFLKMETNLSSKSTKILIQ